MYDDDDLCLTFEDSNPYGGREGERERQGGGQRRGRGGSGRPRGPRRGRWGENTRERRDDSFTMRRYSSSDSLNRDRGPQEDRRFRDRGGRRDNQARGGRDHSYNPSSGYSDSRGRGGRRGEAEGRGGRGRGGGFRGGGEYRGGRRNSIEGGRQKNFPIRYIATVEDTDEVTLRLNSQIDDFTAFMHQDVMTRDDTLKTLKVLTKVIQNHLQREIVLKIMHVVCTSRFLDNHLTALIQHLSSDAEFGSSHVVVKAVEDMHQVLNQVLLKTPSYASKGILLLSALLSMTDIVSLLEQQKPGLVEDLKQLLRESQESMKTLQASGERKERRVREKRGPNEDDDIPPDDFASLPIFPSLDDMDWNKNLFLRANKEEGSYRDVNHYLDVQFRLLREDYIRPLRDGIREFKNQKDRGEVVKKNRDLRLYTKVQVVSMLCKDSLEHRLQFEMTPQLKRVRWQSSKRLLFGSLVCLSVDDFDTVLFAVVTNRDVKDLEKGIIQVRFESGLEDVLELTASDIFIMAETTAYFEAYRHVLEGLQQMKGALPMARYLVDCNSTIKPPRYLLTDDKMGKMNLGAILQHRSRFDASAVTVINPQRWPSFENTTLNDSQLEAVKTALSKELAIIQGPPGTGKTYVGLKVAKVLLENRPVWTDPKVGERPILVVCYTNHALDQFLEGILGFCPEGIVRVGSRCKIPQLEGFNLKNIRQKVRAERKVSTSVRNSIRDCCRKLSSLKSDIETVWSRLEATTKGVVSEKVLQHHMLDGQYDSLVQKQQFAAAATGAPQHGVMLQWLSRGAITHQKGEDEDDPYPMLAAEVTSKILQGEGTCQGTFTDPREVHSLSYTVRAQLYRFWLDKLKAVLQQDVTSSAQQGRNPQESLQWQEAAKRHILPDAVLRRVMANHLFSAITQPLRERHSNLTNFCIRAWLGVAEDESKGVLNRIIHGGETCKEMQFHPNQMVAIPRRTRIQLYRSWLWRLVDNLWHPRNQNQKSKRILAMANVEILPDHLLKDVMSPPHLHVIKTQMMARHQRQAHYFIRSWVGVQDFCQSAAHLEKVLDELDEGPELIKEEEEDVNVEEEADIIQKSRQLDVDDDDDLFDFGKKKSSLDVLSAMQELGVQTTSGSLASSAADDEGFSMPKYHQKKQLRKIKDLLMSSDPMAKAEAERVTSLWSNGLRVEDRIRLYLFWLRSYQDSLRQSVKTPAEEYNSSAKELRELRLGEDKSILEEATVIGMTTTGAARYRRVLTGVACPIVILEEAAEVLEAHVVTTLHQTCQHLILIGDHQQLKPSPTVYELSLRFKLDLSLFERLVNNRLHHSTLAVQHRMRPEIARLVRHVYPELKDHGTTLKRPHIRGMKQDVFLFHHEMEETRSDETSSKSNQYEAELCVRLCRFLLQQGYSRESITVLTAYSGQVFTLKTIMKSDQTFYQGVRVTAVDNYQGEENDIIILSLVRSNQEGIVGFLGTDNRVCVALSRARDGFFAFGNFKILAESSELWKKICRTAKDNGQLGDTLVLRCENHLSQEVKINMAKDFDQMPEGGCKLPCGTRLSCGHVCELSCHGYDRDHRLYRCRKKCERITCKLGHPCTRKCYEDCGKCDYKVTKTVPMCGHQAEMECRRDPHTWQCTDRCQGTLPCAHQCSGVCGKCRGNRSHVSKCTEEVERVWPCGHLVKGACHLTPEELPCDKPCEAALSCSHTCQGTCGKCWEGRVHIPCDKKCGRPLPGCGHKCPLSCGTTCLPCTKKDCGTACHHSSCNLPCGTPCHLCKEECPWKTCKHQKCESLCLDPCSPCGRPCPKKPLSCGTEEHPHPCSGLCGEKCFCFLCEEKNFSPLAITGVETEEQSLVVGEDTELIKLPQCGHIFKVSVLDVYMKKKAESLPAGVIIRCPVNTCNKRILNIDCWRYYHLFQERHLRLQSLKENLVKKTTISQRYRQELEDSLASLTHDAEELKSFASKTHRGNVFTPGAPINVNTAMALSNQIKMAKVLESCVVVLKNTLYDKQTEIKDLDALQKLVYKPTLHMTPQRRDELSAATKRVAYMTKLLCAKKYTTDSGFKDQIESSFKTLKDAKGTEGLEEAESVLQDCRNKCSPLWTIRVKFIDVTSLDQPPDMDLCDVGKLPRRLGSTDKPAEAGEPQTQAQSQSFSFRAGIGKPVVPPKPKRLHSATAASHGASAEVLEEPSSGEEASGSRVKDALEDLSLQDMVGTLNLSSLFGLD